MAVTFIPTLFTLTARTPVSTEPVELATFEVPIAAQITQGDHGSVSVDVAAWQEALEGNCRAAAEIITQAVSQPPPTS